MMQAKLLHPLKDGNLSGMLYYVHAVFHSNTKQDKQNRLQPFNSKKQNKKNTTKITVQPSFLLCSLFMNL